MEKKSFIDTITIVYNNFSFLLDSPTLYRVYSLRVENLKIVEKS